MSSFFEPVYEGRNDNPDLYLVAVGYLLSKLCLKNPSDRWSGIVIQVSEALKMKTVVSSPCYRAESL